MGHTLKNKDLEIRIDFPLENYNFSRFDWTGKIVDVKFGNIKITGVEDPNSKKEDLFGKGFYNEFGIETALGFDETEIGEWFHKIGVGLLKKEDSSYLFNKAYEIKPAAFTVTVKTDHVLINCISPTVNGYSYELRKAIEVHETGFTIKYCLKNTGEKMIHTDEYVHNFIVVDNDFIGENYHLNFPVVLKPALFGAVVNPELAVTVREDGIKFKSTPKEQFFFSNLTGGESICTSWELTHLKSKIGIRENPSFRASKVNLWGWSHVISPELFHEISIAPGEATEWVRRYELFHI